MFTIGFNNSNFWADVCNYMIAISILKNRKDFDESSYLKRISIRLATKLNTNFIPRRRQFVEKKTGHNGIECEERKITRKDKRETRIQ